MGAAYFIVLDNPNPGFVTFVNGKFVVADAQGLSRIAKSMGLRAPEEYFAMSAADAEAMADEFDVDEILSAPPEQWFDADEGLDWVAKLRNRVQADPTGVKNTKGVVKRLERVRAGVCTGKIHRREVALFD